jgi:DNA-binding beta-propeller fold protein YncE
LSVLDNSGFSQELIGWRTGHVTLDSGPGYCFAVLTAPGDTLDTLAFIEQPISPEWAAKLAAWNAQLRVSADVVTESLATQGMMEFVCRWLKADTAWTGPDTMEWSVTQTSIPLGSMSWTGMNPMSLGTQCNPMMPPPEHYGFDCLLARIRLVRPFGGGKVLLDNFGIQITGGFGYPQANWQQFDTLRFYPIAGMPGKRLVHAQLQDFAGNEGPDLVSDTFNFDPIPPLANIVFPNRGQIIGNSDSLVEVLGWALDPPFPEDPMESQYHLSHFKDYKLCWKPATAVWGDSTYGILPESLFYEAALPPPSESAGLIPPWRHLAWWNTKAITDQYGYGHYQLVLTAEDSAGNTTMTLIPVQLDSTRTECASQGTDSGASCIAVNPSANQVRVGFLSGNLMTYGPTLDSISAMTLYDSAGPVIFAGLAVDSVGAFWVADARDQDVKRYNSQGIPTDTLGEQAQPTAPRGIALARNGDVWVADSLRNVIDVYAANHCLKRSFGSTGSDTGQFQGAYGVALTYTASLSLTLHFGPTGNPSFDTTRTTLVRCLVADKGNHRIQVFDTTGHYLSSFGDSVLSQPVALSIDTNNCCYVADIGKHEVCCFSPSGGLYLTVTSADTLQPVGTALSPDNLNLYALDQKTNSLIKYVVLNSDSGGMGGAMGGGVNPLLIPKELILYQSRPNPAVRSLTIRYGIPRRTNVSLKVYDITGKLVRTLETNDKLKPGYYNILWNCRDNRERQVAGGVYFYRLVTGDKQITTSGKVTTGVKTRKLVIAR